MLFRIWGLASRSLSLSLSLFLSMPPVKAALEDPDEGTETPNGDLKLTAHHIYNPRAPSYLHST